jgi:hypothetical protein
MNASLRALLTGLIDYAGLFPPAQLPLDQALQNDAAYRASPDAWMLGRFVCPAARLKDLTAFPPLSVVGRGGATAKDFQAGLQQDREDIAALRQRHPDAVIGCYEVRVSNDLLQPESRKELETTLAGLEGLGTAFLEAEYGLFWGSSILALALPLSKSMGRQMGLKIRCGGATAAAVPSVSDVASALAGYCKIGVPVKFTAGLHHPLAHFDYALPAKVHGFLNVFVAGVLCLTRGLDDETLRYILEDEDPADFRFDDDGLSWRYLHATTHEVAAARKRGVISFGSCSFDEPREDLRALGLLK